MKLNKGLFTQQHNLQHGLCIATVGRRLQHCSDPLNPDRMGWYLAS